MNTKKSFIMFFLTMVLSAISFCVPIQAKPQTIAQPKAKHMTVYANTSIQTSLLFKNTKNVSSLKIKADKPGITISKDKNPFDQTLSFDQKGTYHVKFICNKKITRNITFKVRPAIQTYIKKMPVLKIKQHTRLTHKKLMSKIQFDNNVIGQIFLEGHNINTNEKGEYQAFYSLMSTKRLFSNINVTRKVIVY